MVPPTIGWLGTALLFFGQIWYHPPSAGWELLYSSLPQPNTNYPFTFTVILTENSSTGDVVVSMIYINNTAYTVNVNTPFPWSQIGYVGIRADPGVLFYVSYFGVSPSPFGGVEDFINSVESTSGWGTLPFFGAGQLVFSSPGTETLLMVSQPEIGVAIEVIGALLDAFQYQSYLVAVIANFVTIPNNLPYYVNVYFSNLTPMYTVSGQSFTLPNELVFINVTP